MPVFPFPFVSKQSDPIFIFFCDQSVLRRNITSFVCVKILCHNTPTVIFIYRIVIRELDNVQNLRFMRVSFCLALPLAGFTFGWLYFGLALLLVGFTFD